MLKHTKAFVFIEEAFGTIDPQRGQQRVRAKVSPVGPVVERGRVQGGLQGWIWVWILCGQKDGSLDHLVYPLVI